MGSLDSLGLGRTDKSSEGHDYLWFYELFLGPRRQDKLVLLEMGIGGGGSLKMWRDYFPNSLVVGFDIDPEKALDYGERIKVFIGDQANRSHLQYLVEKYGPFDVVNDDAGHDPAAQLFAYKFLLPHLKPGGIYFLEDIGSREVAEELAAKAVGVVAKESGCCAMAFYREAIVTVAPKVLAHG